MKKLLTLSSLLILLISSSVSAQISGVSTDKFNAFDAATIPVALLELEPTYTYARSLGYFNQDGSYQNRAGIVINSALTLRAAYGLSENFEIGANVDIQNNALGISGKYYLIGNDKFGLGLLGGINSDITNGSRLLSELSRQYVLGISSHYNFSDILSINTSIQYQDSENYLGSDLFINSEVGYYLNDEMFLIAGLGYSIFSNSEFAESNVLSLFPGFNYEKETYNIALQGQFDLSGKNISSFNAIGITITQILIDKKDRPKD